SRWTAIAELSLASNSGPYKPAARRPNGGVAPGARAAIAPMPPYFGQPASRHGGQVAAGVVLVNLGTPKAPTPEAVRRYLAEFLSAPRIVERPRWLWKPILHGVILRVRPKRSAALYQKIWTPEGSPLLTGTAALASALEAA